MLVPSLLLLRGLPGSGKSTLAALLSENGTVPVFSIDDYFTNPQTGEYKFQFEKNHLAYQQCEFNTRTAMEKGKPKIIVDNVFSMDWEMQPYIQLAKEFSYKLFVVTVEKYHDGKNIHEVSEEQLNKMSEKFKVKLK